MIYEYKCKKHGVFERWFWTKEIAKIFEKNAYCPKCRKKSKRIISLVNTKTETGRKP